MKILITGSSGFVGEELITYFQDKRDCSIVGVDKNEDIVNSKIIFKKCNLISEKEKLDSIFADFLPDVVINQKKILIKVIIKSCKKINIKFKKNFLYFVLP